MQPADARLHVFESASEATRIWIKGEGFTVGKLVGRQLAKRLDLQGCSLVISRCTTVPALVSHCAPFAVHLCGPITRMDTAVAFCASSLEVPFQHQI